MIQVLRLHPPEYPSDERTQGATIRIVENLKNNADHPPGSVANISFGGQNVYTGPGALSDPSRKLAAGDRVFLLYPRAHPGTIAGIDRHWNLLIDSVQQCNPAKRPRGNRDEPFGGRRP